MQAKSSSAVRIVYPTRDRDQLIRGLREPVQRLFHVLPIRRVVLFGSYAKGPHTAGSDADQFVVNQGEPRGDAYAVTKKTLNIPRIEPRIYTEAEHEARRRPSSA
jgi:uncharacterized protein